MAEIRINATGGVKLYDADDSHYAQIIAGTITSNTDVMTLGHNVIDIPMTTASSSATTGALTIGGGLGVAADLYVGDDTYLITDSAVLGFGADKDTTLTHTDGTGLTLNSTNKLCFNDATQFVQGISGTVLGLGATDEIDLTATTVDLNGTLNVSGVATFQAAPVFPDGSLALADLDIDGGTDIGAAIVDADLFIVDDGAGGTNRKVTASRIKTYAGGAALANDGNNRVVTADGSDGLNGEANLSFDGSTLAVTGATTISGTTTLSDSMTVIDDKGVIFGTGSDWMWAAKPGEDTLEIFKGGTNATDTNEGSLIFKVGDSADSYITIMGGEAGTAVLYLSSDQADDNADQARIKRDPSGIFFAVYNDGVWDDEFQIADDNIMVEHTISVETVDYAEFFEWKTELANDEKIKETYGLTVVLDNNKVRLAEAGEEAKVLGVIRPSKVSSTVGGDGIYWKDRYKKNVWGEHEKEAYTQVNWHILDENGGSLKHYSFIKDRIPQYELIHNHKEDVKDWHLLDSNFKRDGDGNKIVLAVPTTDEEKVASRYTERTTHKKTGKPLMRRVFSDSFDQSQTYINRSERRKEWCVVGLLGQVPIRDTAVIPTHWKLMKNLESGIDLYYIK